MRKIARILLTGVLLLSFIVLPLVACSGGKDRETINALLEEKEKVFQGEDEVAFANYIKLVRSTIANNNSLSRLMTFYPMILRKILSKPIVPSYLAWMEKEASMMITRTGREILIGMTL